MQSRIEASKLRCRNGIQSPDRRGSAAIIDNTEPLAHPCSAPPPAWRTTPYKELLDSAANRDWIRQYARLWTPGSPHGVSACASHRNNRRPSRHDGSRRHQLGHLSRLSQPHRNLARLPGLHLDRHHLHHSRPCRTRNRPITLHAQPQGSSADDYPPADRLPCRRRSEEHTSELQSLMRISYA